ncbi:unnamed protein product, partial [marine sediment metagenome]
MGVRGFERASGGVIAEKLARYLTSTAGVFYLGANKITTTQQDTSPAGPPNILTRWYHDAGGNWVSNTGIEGASGVNLYNHMRNNHERLMGVRGFERASGGVIAEKLARYLTSTAGVFYLGANKITTTQQDTSPAGPPNILTRWYHDAGGNWVSNTGIEGASAAGQI